MESRQRQFEMALQTINKFYNDLSDTERKKSWMITHLKSDDVHH